MSTLFARPLAALAFLLLALCLSVGAARAELVWNPQTGWRVEGGALSGMSGPEARNALELMNKARAAEEQGGNISALRSYAKVTKKYPNSIYAAEAYYHTAKLRLARKQYYQAFDAFEQILIRYPNTRRFSEIIGEQYRIASALLDGARPRIMWGLLPGMRNRARAIEYFESILAFAPYSDYAPLALMNVARGHLKQRNTEEAIDALDRMINSYPQSLLAPDAYLKLGQTHALLVEGPYYDQGSTKQALTYFEDFMILFPNDSSIPTAAKGLDSMKQMLSESKMKIGDFYFYKRSNFTAARVFYNEAITAYPDSPVAKRAKQRLAEVEAKAAGKAAPADPTAPARKKRFWLF
jgi:outer membrane protein assembly factor BamD